MTSPRMKKKPAKSKACKDTSHYELSVQLKEILLEQGVDTWNVDSLAGRIASRLLEYKPPKQRAEDMRFAAAGVLDFKKPIRNQGGWSHSKKSIALMCKNRKGLAENQDNGRWRGQSVSYAALHNWVRQHWEKPRACEHCMKNPGYDKRGHTKLQWANRNKKYLRTRKDWICLCIPCHRKYDISHKIHHRYEGR